ncbi:MAG TPA: NAD(P)/FAD-dependent oxidoreductase [Edaphocola sp.]|nr:NAD(P)/FAD-dependent oxidoreductase [Edaphocola sp.]
MGNNRAGNKRLAIVGGGAAGFFCAVNAAEQHPDLDIVLLEKSSRFLSKVAVSGGGRCNVTQACSSISEMLKAYPRGSRFLKKAFYQFFTNDTVDWFQRHGVTLKTEPDGRMFPITNTSETVMQCLLHQARDLGVQLLQNKAVQNLKRAGDAFEIVLKDDGIIPADYVCIACGGLPKLSQYDLFKDLALSVVPPVPSLFTFNLPQHPIRALMGVSVPETEIKLVQSQSKLKTTGPLLITHWGLSGPVVLKLSAVAARLAAEKNYRLGIQVNWLPEYNEEHLRQMLIQYRQQHGAAKVAGKNPFGLPARLWQFFMTCAEIADVTHWADLPAKAQNRLTKILCAHEMTVSGKTTFKEEFVTAGGISLDEIDPQTMMCKKHPGLFFAGEILDIDGITGGYNFQNAWTTGFIAAKNIKSPR